MTPSLANVGDAVRAGSARLSAAQIPSARLDARLLVAEVVGISAVDVFSRPETPLSQDQQSRLDTFLQRRAAREPVSRILGRRGFWTLDLAVGADTLDPRPDSETVVEAVLEAVPDRRAAMRLLDFGTGTGCLLLALLSELPNARGLGVDKSAGALGIARANAIAAGLDPRATFVLGDWGSALHGSFNVIVSNPPYIPDKDIAGLDPEVARYDPRFALAGGEDGLDCYRALAPDIGRLLAPGGIAALEVGEGQAAAVAGLLEGAGLSIRTIRSDLAGIARCVVAVR